MKKALVFEGQIVQIEAVSFLVAPELIWVDVADDVSAETHMFNGVEVVVKPAPPPRTYQQLRAAAYPPIVDQLDTIFHGGLDAWKAEIQAVKTKYPKEVA
jgi:hypothetical protein